MNNFKRMKKKKCMRTVYMTSNETREFTIQRIYRFQSENRNATNYKFNIDKSSVTIYFRTRINLFLCVGAKHIQDTTKALSLIEGQKKYLK